MADGCQPGNTPRTWLPSARLARTNWSRDPSSALSRWLASDFTRTALYQAVRSISANA